MANKKAFLKPFLSGFYAGVTARFLFHPISGFATPALENEQGSTDPWLGWPQLCSLIDLGTIRNTSIEEC